jgi:hypothetical protein
LPPFISSGALRKANPDFFAGKTRGEVKQEKEE